MSLWKWLTTCSHEELVRQQAARIVELEREVARLVPEVTRLADDNDKLIARLRELRPKPAVIDDTKIIRARTAGDVRRQFEKIVGSAPIGEENAG